MIADQPTDGSNSLMITEDRSLRFEEKKENELGKGAFGVVYRGTYEGNAVAVKVTVKKDSDDARKKKQKREMEEHLQLDHENVLKLLHVDDSRDKTCLVLVLCAGTLKDFCVKKYKGPELPPDGIVLYQIADGLHYIHSRKLVHRDVKPVNILISLTTPVQMKLSDFGLVKKTSSRGTFTQSGLKGTEKWMAPEILELMEDDDIIQLPRGTIQSDTFAAGCVFFYFLTRGKHPFGKSIQIMMNILNNNPIELNQHKKNLQGDHRALYKLIGKMMKPKEERILLPEVIEGLNFFNSTFTLNGPGQFKIFVKSVSGIDYSFCRFHPTEPVIACVGVDDKVILLSADNSSIPFSKWKEMKTQLQLGNIGRHKTIEWNVDGTQLAAASHKDKVIVWSYPSGAILFQKKLDDVWINRIEWNPFSPNLFTICRVNDGNKKKRKVVSFFNSCPVGQQSFHFYTIEREKWIDSVKWISENRVAFGLFEGWGIEIWEIDESTTSAKYVKGFQHKSVKMDWIKELAWDERTKCLAACSYDGWLTIWSMDSDQPIHDTKVDGTCRRLAWRPNGKQTDGEGVLDAARKSANNFILACGMKKGQIVIWTPLAKKMTTILSQHSNRVTMLSFTPDGRFLASADDEKKLIIWETDEDWEPVYIGEEKIKQDDRFSWMSSSSTDVPDYKLTYKSNSKKVVVIEYAEVQCEKPVEDDHERIAKEKETRAENG